MITEFGEIKQT